VTGRLDGLAQPLKELVEATKENGKDLLSLRDQFGQAEVHSRSLQEVFSRNPATNTITIGEGEQGTIFLQWLDEDLEPTSCAITVMANTAKDSRGRFKVRLSGKDCATSEKQSKQGSWQETYDMSQNEPLDLEPTRKIPFHVSVSDVDRHLWKKSVFVVRFQPDARHWQKRSSVTAAAG
jgi:hypothetical protein